ICVKALSKRASERYTTAKDMADDLRCFLVADEDTGQHEDTKTSARGDKEPASVSVSANRPLGLSVSGPRAIVPKGLLSFDEQDADFFVELLPGPRDRDGLPG